jgi:hypothetical protein
VNSAADSNRCTGQFLALAHDSRDNEKSRQADYREVVDVIGERD